MESRHIILLSSMSDFAPCDLLLQKPILSVLITRENKLDSLSALIQYIVGHLEWLQTELDDRKSYYCY